MFEAFRSMLRKRRRTDSGSGSAGPDGFSHNDRNASTSYTAIFDDLFNFNSAPNQSNATATNSNNTEQQQQQRQQQQVVRRNSTKTNPLEGNAYSSAYRANNNNNSTNIEPCEDMEIDPTPAHHTTATATASTTATGTGTAETSNSHGNHLNSTLNKAHEESVPSPMNFDYLQGLHESGGAANNSARSSTMSAFSDASATATTGGSGSSMRQYEAGSGQQIVDDSRVIDRFVSVLDHLDAHVEKFRKDALGLQEKRDYLLMSIDLIKSNDLLHNMSDPEREEIHTYIQRVNSRLGTVELNVRTVRDTSQEDSLSQINALIDMMITLGDPVLSRQRCQQYLNACCSSAEAGGGHCGEHYSEVDVFVQQSCGGINMETDIGPVDKKFESALLGCTLDDQKNIKKRLQALMDYLNKQTISH